MIKNKTILEVLVNEKPHQYFCEPSSSLGEVFDALTQMRAFVIERMKADNQPLVEEPSQETCQENICNG